MDIFPAIDLLGGRAVRLTRGDYEQVKVYGDDPAAIAADFAARGARYLHVVDLDGARTGAPVNLDAVRRIAAVSSLYVEVGGGIRNEARIEELLASGVSRVILGTAAVRDFAFLARAARRYGDRAALGVDARGGRVAVNGWVETTREDSFDFCRRARDAGVGTVVYTDIDTDGTLRGTNLPAFRRLCGMAGLRVVASGGICTREELRALRDMGCAGAIVGKALYEGALTLEEVLSL